MRSGGRCQRWCVAGAGRWCWSWVGLLSPTHRPIALPAALWGQGAHAEHRGAVQAAGEAKGRTTGFGGWRRTPWGAHTLRDTQFSPCAAVQALAARQGGAGRRPWRAGRRGQQAFVGVPQCAPPQRVHPPDGLGGLGRGLEGGWRRRRQGRNEVWGEFRGGFMAGAWGMLPGSSLRRNLPMPPTPSQAPSGQHSAVARALAYPLNRWVRQQPAFPARKPRIAPPFRSVSGLAQLPQRLPPLG